ncbi:hypothetical protein [Frankia canadensis]|uniref:hypothetical protein n=1 Tax=Frankia canadensis TaxID=1836972 RepID=UPI001402160A|nr:hypothetical protein [Frankia canadensis]
MGAVAVGGVGEQRQDPLDDLVSWSIACVLDVCAGQAPRRSPRAHQQALACAS